MNKPSKRLFLDRGIFKIGREIHSRNCVSPILKGHDRNGGRIQIHPLDREANGPNTNGKVPIASYDSGGMFKFMSFAQKKGTNPWRCSLQLCNSPRTERIF
jgi:hypothetical protein